MRPKPDDPRIIERVAKKLAPSLADGEDLPHIEESLKSVLEDNYDWGAYKLAKSLDNDFGWDISQDDLDTLEDAELYQHTYHQELVEQWVKENNICPQFSFGDIVHYRPAWPKIYYIGEVMGVIESRAQYIVHIPELMHGSPKTIGHGVILNYEEVW